LPRSTGASAPRVSYRRRPKTAIYKIWVTVEKITEPGTLEEDYEDITLPDSLAWFDTEEAALAFLDDLPRRDGHKVHCLIHAAPGNPFNADILDHE